MTDHTNTIRPDNAARRPLPAGYADECDDMFIPRPLRSYYQTVTAGSDEYATVLDAIYEWMSRDYPHGWPLRR